jgi:DNA (cytosine-5)-methyltransferase 1
MTHGSLFSGVGGFDLAAEWMGWENVFHCEINEFCRKVLHKHWPNVAQYKDITTTDFSGHRGAIDVITGGFPCPSFSTAGKRLGTEDPRYLWPAMFKSIRQIQPRYVVAENVRGLTNWKEGMVFDQVQADLETEGYEVLPFLLPAAGVDAPHRRDRIWIIAHSGQKFADWRESTKIGSLNNRESSRWKEKTNQSERLCQARAIADAKSNTIGAGFCAGESNGNGSRFDEPFFNNNWRDFPTVTPVLGRNDGIPNRVDRLKSIGNAIVPQVALQIFRTIDEFEKLNACK